MTEIEIQASLTAFGHSPSRVTAVVIEQTPAQRLGRTLAGLGMFWALALGGLFIPVAHFILVPTFVVTGIIVAVKRARGSPVGSASRGLPPLRRGTGVQGGRTLCHRAQRRLPEVSWHPDATGRRDRRLTRP